jgi:DMSO reductase anchor subunit
VKPALSVIVFTVSSGAGLGLAVWLVLARALGAVADDATFWRAAACAFVLVTAGFVSSTLHLANRRSAWRAFTCWRTSWLSREGVAALAFYAASAAYVAAAALRAEGALAVAGVLVVACAACTVFSTGMIYACLKTIPQWRTWHTVVAYPLLGLAGGLVAWIALRGPAAPAALAAHAGVDVWRELAVALLAAAGVVKLAYWAKFPGTPAGPTMNDALGLRDGAIRLLDPGHTHGTFLTDEFGFRIARERARTLRGVALLAGFVVPMALLEFAPGAAGAAAVLCVAGLLVERWLFFAEARHVVRLYHGMRD